MDRGKTRILLETGIGSDVLGLGRPRESIAPPVRLVTSGRLVPSKNTRAAIEALALLPDHYGAVLEILGDGPERSKCERLAASLGLGDRVFFAGNLPRPVALQHTLSADVFLMPSLKECGSWALMEAMALGLPSICLRWTGMRVIASDSTSIMLDPHEPTPLARRMSDGICRIVETPGLAASMSKAATERIATVFTWDASGAFLQDLLEGAYEGGSSVGVGDRS
jgi:glycosyltransferase involved in cell wall biosynthesis